MRKRNEGDSTFARYLALDHWTKQLSLDADDPPVDGRGEAAADPKT